VAGLLPGPVGRSLLYVARSAFGILPVVIC
jgi:hypothetical protein